MAGEVDGDKARRTGRLNGRARPMQVEKMGNTVAHKLFSNAHDGVLRLVSKVADETVFILGHIGGGSHKACRLRTGHAVWPAIP